MHNTYVFVGLHTIIGDREYADFGAQADFTQEQFSEISKKAAFIPEADFNALEIPAEDLKKYGSVHFYGAKPQSFLDAVEAARDVYRALQG
jgi:hypothetical protein